MRISIFLYIFLFIFQSYNIAYASPEVEQYVNNVINQASTILAGSSSAEEKVTKSKSLLSQNLDFNWMAMHVLGRHWNNITPEQKSDFSESYKDYVIKSYSSLVKKYKGQKTVVKAVKPAGGEGEYIVQTNVQGGDCNINVNYFIRKCGGGFKISDIVTEGVSLITSQRDEFTSIINNQGFDELLEILESK